MSWQFKQSGKYARLAGNEIKGGRVLLRIVINEVNEDVWKRLVKSWRLRSGWGRTKNP